MPCDYGSRHPNPINHLSLDEQVDLGFDHGQDIYVRRMINISNSPAALNSEDIHMENDGVYKLTRETLEKGAPHPKTPSTTRYGRNCVWLIT